MGGTRRAAVDEGFAGYALHQQLARGSLGTLHLARRRSGERVLLRVLPLEAPYPMRVRVSADLDRLAKVDHPGVAALLDEGESSGIGYYALAYPGHTTLLRFVQEQRPLTPDELTWVARHGAEAVTALHRVGLFHGDLWAGKIALTPAGPVLVELGWGIRARDPERRPGPSDFLADWRGLAATLVFAATGEHPERATDGVLEAPESWDVEAASLPPELASLVDGLLGDANDGPSLQEAKDGFFAVSLPPDERLEGLGNSLKAMGSDHATSILAPVDSDAAPPPEESTVDVDDPRASKVAGSGRVAALDEHATGDVLSPTRSPLERTSDGPPPDVHVLRDGLSLTHLEVLGRGGMGIVHLVRDPQLGRRAALKLIRGSVSEGRVRRFRREIKITSRLAHPGVPAVFEAGRTTRDRDFLLMQYVDGESLAERIETFHRAGKKGEPRDLLHALVKVAETVAFAHSRRIVHRDLKPANIMLGGFGKVFVMDWGLARDLTETTEEDQTWTKSGASLSVPIARDLSDITQEGAILGTPGYIPPEQAVGRDVDARADVFALGAILTDILTGRPPVTGDDAVERVELTRAGHIEIPSQRHRDVSPELDAIARTATSMEADDRYSSAKAFAVDLQAYLEAGNVSVYSYAPRERALRWARRHPTITASALVALVLGLLAVTASWQADAERLRRCQALVLAGDRALEEGKSAQAREHFASALALVPTHAPAVIGKHKAEELEAGQRETELARREAEEDVRRARRLIERGRAYLEAGELEAARRAYEQALAVQSAPPEAGEGLMKVKTLLAEREAREDVRQQRERDARLAARHLADGKRFMSGKERDLEKAQVAFTKAVAFGSKKARALLVKNEELLLEQRVRERQQARRWRDEAKARALIEEAREAYGAGDLSRAKAAFLQALAFQGGNEVAQEGLMVVDRALQKQRSATERGKRRRSADNLRSRGRALMSKGRTASGRGPAGDARARESYFGALVAYDKALAFVPGDRSLREEKLRAVREVATHLRSRGQNEFADFLLRYGGGGDQDEAIPAQPDELVELREADHSALRAAFGGPVRFQSSAPFPRLRTYLEEREGRFRVLLQVRSRASGDKPPKVLATGLWVRVEDTATRTVFPLEKLTFSGGPYPRRVMVSPSGRVIGPFDQAHSLDVRRLEERVLAIVRRRVDAAR
jgi:serine/threonine protein kinase